VTTDDLKKQLKKIKDLPSGFDENFVLNYVEKNWKNIHVLNKEKLKKFLIYSFLPFPELFSEIGDEEEE
jgi:hypothetical protein